MEKIRRGERVHHFETLRRSKDGTLIPVSVTISPIKDSSGEITGISAIDRDITREKELEKRKDEFIVSVNHELRTPLTTLSGYLDLLVEHRKQLDATAYDTFLEKARTGCDELIHLVNSMLDALRMKYEGQLVRPEHLLVTHLVTTALEHLDPRKARVYTFHIDIADDLSVWADRECVTSILINLLTNVCKYVPEHTPVEISAYHMREAEGNDAKHSVCIAVKDEGPGIPPAEMPFLFQKFMRLQRDVSSTIRGTGLGLYICKQLVKTMGGDMWVESSGQCGEGSRFCFTLPDNPATFSQETLSTTGLSPLPGV